MKSYINISVKKLSLFLCRSCLKQPAFVLQMKKACPKFKAFCGLPLARVLALVPMRTHFAPAFSSARQNSIKTFKPKLKRFSAMDVKQPLFAPLLLALIFSSCSDTPATDPKNPSQLEHSAKASVAEEPTQDLKRADLADPRIYLYKTGEALDIPSVNREDFILTLWDQIVFWKDQPEEAPSQPASLPLADVKEGALKLKIASFCSYLKDDELSKRQEKESGYDRYPLFVRLIDLIPEKILLEGGRAVFYCSFIVGLKNESLSNEEAVFDWFNISQQMISPHADVSMGPFHGASSDSPLLPQGGGAQSEPNSENLSSNPFSTAQEEPSEGASSASMAWPAANRKLSLVRETESGRWLSVENQLISPLHADKIYLLNESALKASAFYLMCNGRQWGMIFSSANKIPVFMNINVSAPESGPEGDLSCRFWAKEDQKIIAMTGFFQLDRDFFNSYKLVEPGAPDLQKVQLAGVFDHNVSIDPYRNALNSYFMLEILEQKTLLDYSSVDIHIENTCSSNRNWIFGGQKTKTTIARFPFRQKFPIMAAMPLETFLLHRMGGSGKVRIKRFMRGFRGDLRSNGRPYRMSFRVRYFFNEDSKRYAKIKDSYSLNCHYSISLKDRSDPQNIRVFETLGYREFWSNAGYGVNYIPAAPYPDITPVVPQSAIRENKTQYYLLSMKDIEQGKAGYFMYDFFDIMDDPFFATEGANIDKARLVCHANHDHQEAPVFIESSWPYSSLPQPLLLQTIFLDPKIKAFIDEKILTLCRFMLYEGDLLRYFSSELKVTK